MANRYLGSFVQGKRHGQGTFFYSSGAHFEGTWDNDEKHGPGKFVFEDGLLYDKGYNQDRPVEKYPDNPLRPAFQLHIGDLLDEHELCKTIKSLSSDPVAKAAQLETATKVKQQEVANSLLRYNTELLDLYRYYSTLDLGACVYFFLLLFGY